MMEKHEWKVLTRAVSADDEARRDWLLAARESGAVAFIDKDEQWTSFDCIAKLRSIVGIRRIGHAGTLDPLATGLLIVCLGKATKDVESFQDANKMYDVAVRLGAYTETDDRESMESVPRFPIAQLGASVQNDMFTESSISQTLMQFVGTIVQIPPAYSAVRHGKKRQYDLARAGKTYINKPRVVTITSIENVQVMLPDVSFTVTCSKGTYIRSLARDLGEKLGCGGYVWTLRRTRIGHVDVSEAVPMREIVSLFDERATA